MKVSICCMICVRYVLYVNNRHRPIHPHFSSLDFGILNTHTPPSLCPAAAVHMYTSLCAIEYQKVKYIVTILWKRKRNFSLFFSTLCRYNFLKNVQMDAFNFGPKTSFHERISVFSQHSFHHFVKIQIFVQLFFYIS